MEQGMAKPDEASARKHLIKGVIKAVPLIGDIVNEMTFEVAKDEADKRSKVQLAETLNKIQEQGNATNTDLGDILNQLERQAGLSENIVQALQAIAKFLQGNADAVTSERVALATNKVWMKTGENAMNSIDRFELSRAMESQLTPEDVTRILSDIPAARDNVPVGAAKLMQIDALLNWAASIAGPGYDGLVGYILRRYPQFKMDPQ